MNIGGAWYSDESLFRMGLRWTDAELRETKSDSSRRMVWVPSWLAHQKGLIGGGPWQSAPEPLRPLKKPNDQGVVQFLAGRCRELVPA